MTTLHKLTWNKKDLGIYVNFESKSKQLIETYVYEGVLNSPMDWYIDWYNKELNVKFRTCDLSHTRRLKQLTDFWAYMPIYVDKERAGKRTKFYNYLIAKNLFGYDTDYYTQEDIKLELTIKLWLAHYYRKRLSLLYVPEPSIFEHLSPKVKSTPNDYRTLLKVSYFPSSTFVCLELTEWGNKANNHVIVLPYDVYKSTSVSGQTLFENIESLFRTIFNLPTEKNIRSM